MKKELPKNWVYCTLNDLATIQSGGTPARSNSQYWNGNIPWVKISDIKEFYVEETAETITDEGLKNSSTRIFPKGTILFTIFATIGKVGVLKIDAATNQAIAGITPVKLVNSKFITYSLIELSNEILGLGKGVAQKNINQTILKNTKFPLPPLAEQTRIVAKLDRLFGQLDTVKASMEKIPVLLKNFRQQVLTQAVTGKLTEEWRSGKGLQDWEKIKIGILFDVKTGATPKRGNTKYYENGTIPWLKSGQVRNEFIHTAEEFITEAAITETNAKLFPIDTLLVAMYGEGKTRGQVGWMKIEAASNQAIAALVNTEMSNVTRTYIYHFCLSQYNEIRAQAEGGNQPNLNLSKIKNWEVNLPPEKEQKVIVNRIEILFSKADAIAVRYQLLKEKIDQLPQALLHKAFKGELVPQLESDGDARELLEEIQVVKQQNKPKTIKGNPKKYKRNEEGLGKAAEEASDYKK